MKAQSSTSTISSVAVSLLLLVLTSQLVITQVNSAVTTFRVYKYIQPAGDYRQLQHLQPSETNSESPRVSRNAEVSEGDDLGTSTVDPVTVAHATSMSTSTSQTQSPITSQSEIKIESFIDPWLPNAKENGTEGSFARRRRFKGKRRRTTIGPIDLTSATEFELASGVTEADIFITETTEPVNTVSGVVENTHEISTAASNKDTMNGHPVNSKENKSEIISTTEVSSFDLSSSTFRDLFAPLPNHQSVSNRRKNLSMAKDQTNLDHITQLKDNENKTDLHIGESTNPYINSSTPISTELQKSSQFEHLHPLLGTDNIITSSEKKLPDNTTIHIQNELSSSLTNTPISHDVRHSPRYIRKKHPLLNHDSVISKDFTKNGPRLDAPALIDLENTNSIYYDPKLKASIAKLPEHTSIPSFVPSVTLADDDIGQKGYTLILPKDFHSLENIETTNALDLVNQLGNMESTTKFNRQTEQQMHILSPVPSTSTPTSGEQLNEYELLQQLLSIEKSLSEVNIPNQPTSSNSNAHAIPPQLSNQSNEDDLKALLQLPEFSFLDTILNHTVSSTTKATSTITAVPKKSDKDKGLSDDDLRSIYYMLERMVIHANNASSTVKPVDTTTSAKPVDTTTSAKPTTTTTTTTTTKTSAFASFDKIFNLFGTSGQTNQGKRNIAPGPVYKHPNSRQLDGNTNSGAAQVPAAPVPQKPVATDNSLDLLSQLLQLTIAAENANSNKPTTSTPAPAPQTLDLLTLLANTNLLGQGSPLTPAPVQTQQKIPEMSASESMQLLNIFSNQQTPKPNGLYYWLDLNAFLGGDPTADPTYTSGIRPKIGHREHFVKIR